MYLLHGFDHSRHPKNETYAYITVPHITLELFENEYNDQRNREILSNSPEIQAVTMINYKWARLFFMKLEQLYFREI